MIRLSLTAGLLCAACLKQDACESEIAVLSPVGQGMQLATLFRPAGGHFVGEIAHLTRKNDSEAARQLQPSPLPEPAEPRYRGMRSGALLRHIAERASSCNEALAVIEDFVKRGYWAGGSPEEAHVERWTTGQENRPP